MGGITSFCGRVFTWPQLKRAIAVFMASLTAVWGLPLAGSLTAPSAAHAVTPPDADVAAITSGLTQFCTFTQGLAGDGKFGQPLPMLNLIPGSDAGFGFSDLCQSSVGAQVSSTSPVHCSDLANLANSSLALTNSRTAKLAISNLTCGNATSGGTNGVPDQFTLDLQVDRSVTTGLDLTGSGNQGPITVTSPGGVTAALHTDLSVTFAYNWDNHFFYVVDSGANVPTLTGSATISLPSTVDAGIGILKASLSGTLTGAVSFSATMSDPTGTGQLGFTLGTGGAGNTALATAMIGNIFTVGFSGSLTGSLSLAPDSIGSFTFPSGDDASFMISIPDITNPPAQPFTGMTNFSNLLDDFQNLTPRDLADGLGHEVQAIRAIEAANTGVNLNVNLPFMSGKLSDAAKVEEALAQFLVDNVTTTTNTQQGGGGAPYEVPKFASIQDLQALLNGYSPSTGSAVGSSLGVTNLNFDPDIADSPPKPKLSFTLGLSRSAGTPVSLDPGAQTAYPGSTNTTYGSDTVKDTSPPSPAWTTNEWTGDQVVTTDGLHNGIVATNTADTLTLQAPWIGGQPSDGTGYSIKGQDPKTGLVNLGTVKQSGNTFFANANATVAQATVNPSYTASVTMVLDLEPAVTGTACETYYYNPVENPTNAACPFVKQNGDGSQNVVNSLPTAPDRIMIRTGDSGGNEVPLFTFDAPIDTQVSLDAQAGFLDVHLSGDLKECTTNASADCTGTTVSGDHLVNVSLKPQGDAAHNYDVPISQLFADLTCSGMTCPGPLSLLDASVHGQAYANLTVSVPQAAAFFGGNPSVSTSLTMADITDPTNVSLDTSNLSQLADFNFDPSNPSALFGAIVKGLQVLLQTLQNTSGAAKTDNSALDTALNTSIPGLNRSLKDLLAGSEGGLGSDVTYDTTTFNSQTVGRITDSGKSWTPSAYKGRAVVVGTNLMTIADNDATTLTLTANWSGTTPAAGTPYMINNELEAALSTLTANPSNTLQSVVTVLNNLLGTNAVQFTVNTSDSTNPMLELDVDWKRTYSTEAPLAFDLAQVPSIPDALKSIVGVQASGVATFNANAELQLGLLLPMTTDTTKNCYLPTTLDPSALLNTLCITPGSSITAGATGSVTGSIQANIGPVAIALGDPSDTTNHGAEANATLSVGLKDSTDTTPVSIGTFLSNVGVKFDDGAAVTCPSDTANTSSVPLAVCASLPLYVKNGSTWNPVGTSGDEFFLRLPQESDPADTFNLAGADIATGIPRFGASPDLATIGTDIAAQVLDLNALNGGIDGYFQFAENALNLASDNGNLPLVGHDLQEGSAFLTNLQSQFDTALTTLAGASTVMGVENAANNGTTSLQGLLTTAKMLPSGGKVTVGVECNSGGQLTSPGATVTQTLDSSNTGKDSQTYYYEIVALTGDGNGGTVAAPAGTAGSDTNIPTLDAKDYNTVAWTAESNVTYQVWRSTDGTNYYQLTNGTTTTFTQPFKDDGSYTVGTTAYTAPTASPCDPNTSVTNINGVTLEVIVGQGNVSSTQGCFDDTTDTANPCLGAGLGTPFSIGIPGLSMSAAGGPSQNLLSVKLGWKLHLKFGLDTTHGFFICTTPKTGTAGCATSGGDNPIAAGVALNIPSGMKLNIAFLQMCVANHSTTTPDPCNTFPDPATPAFAGEFDVALNAPSATPGMLTAPELAGGDLSSLVTPTLSAAVNLDWDFLVDTSAGPSLPGLGGEFKLSWSWTSQAAGVTDPNISFDNVYIDAGTFLSGVLGNVVDEVNTILNPIRPVIDVLEAPIPVLTQLSEAIGGPPITLITIAEAFSTLVGGPDLSAIDEVVQAVKFVADLTSEIAAMKGTSIHIPLGSFNVLGSAAKATTATPDNTDSLVDQSSVKSCDGSGTLPAQCNGKSTFDDLNSSSGSVLNDAQTTSSSESQYGFQFNALKHPASLLSVLMGKDVELFSFDSGPLTLAFSYSQQFGPVYAPPPVLVVIAGSASVTARIRIGFDTAGIREAVAASNAGGVVSGILDGLYISTTDPTTGQPIPAITLTGTLAAGAEVSVVLISVGIEGGITLTINLLWNDPDNDGKLRFGEFLAGLENPLCLFNFSGSLTAFIKLFITIGFSPFDFSFSFDLVNITLLDFSTNNSCAKPQLPPVLGAVSGGVLYVYAGNLGTGAFRNNPSSPGDGWGNDSGQHYTNADEKFLVTENHDPTSHAFTGMTIDWSGHEQEFDDTSITSVELDARGYAGAETLTLNGDGKQADNAAAFDKGAVVFGGNKNNVINVDDSCPNGTACTVGNVYVDGGTGGQSNGNQINVGDATADVAGGPGGNQVQVGNGDDWVAGNNALTFSTTTYKDPTSGNSATVVDPTSVGHPSTWSDNSSTDGNNTIHVGLGQNTVWGGADGNNISVAKDSPLSTLPSGNAKFCNTPGLCVAKGETIVGGGGSNHISSGSGTDTIWAGQYAAFNGFGNWTGVSGDGFNTVDTGPGNKTVYAGSGGDYIVGHSVPGTVDTFYGGAQDDELIGGNGNDKIYGGQGNDVIIGGTGSSLLEGLSGDNYIVAGGGDVEPKAAEPETAVNDGNGVPIRTVTQTPLSSTPQDGHNTIIGGSGSNHIYGGDNGDTIYGHQQVETCAPPAAGQPPYAVQYDPTKEAAGEAADFDYIYAGPGDDTISGGGGTNYIDSGAGNDVVCAGTGNDTVIGHSTANQTDKFYGIAGKNTIYGGNGRDQLIGGVNDDTIYAGSGNSYIEGGNGANVIYAGGGNDAIIGGTSTAAKTHNADAGDPAGTGGRLFGGTGVSIIVGDNGCVDMTPNGPEVSFAATLANPVTVNSCNPSGSPNKVLQTDGSSGALQVFDLGSANPLYGENNYIVGGQGPSMMFGGLGSNTIFGGASDNYIEGGTGNNYIEGHGGNNDIVGGSSPSYLPDGTCGTSPGNTSCIPAGVNHIYGDDGTGGVTSHTTDGSDAIIGDNGQIKRAGVFPGWQASALLSNLITWGDGSIVPNRTITDLDIYTGDLQGSGSWIFGGTKDDFLFGGPGGNHIFGGPPVVKGVFDSTAAIDPNGAYGNDYIEGGPGFNHLSTGGGQNDMIGGVSPLHLAAGKTTSNVANLGSFQVGGNGDNYMVADNGEIDHECGPAGSPSVAACTTPSTSWTKDPNDGAYFRTVTLDDLLTIGGDSTLLTGNGYDHAYGGIGNDTITGGTHDDYLMGGPGNNTITGVTGSNDIIGGTAPEVLPSGITTKTIPSGHNLIYAGANSPADGNNVVIGNNGDITRQHDSTGTWLRSDNDPNDQGIIQRNIVNLDIYGYPLASEPGTRDVQGASDVIFGGTRDDILLGGPGGNAMYAGPPSTTGSIVDPTTSKHFDNTQPYGNNHIEGGPGQNAIFGAGGDDDIIGGVSPFYLQSGHDTGTVGSLDFPTHAGNLLVGGTGNDYIAGANAQIDHLCGPAMTVCVPGPKLTNPQWAFNVNDIGGTAGPNGASIRRIELLNLDTATGPNGPVTRGIGSDNQIYGTAGDNHLYGENGNNSILGGPGNDYIEGGTGSNLIQGGGGDDDIIGGVSPNSLVPAATVALTDAKAAGEPNGNNVMCAYLCGKTDPLTVDHSNDTDIVAHNGRIDRCAAVVKNGAGTPQGSDSCTWTRTNFGNEKVRSVTGGVQQTGQICTAVGPGCPVVSLGDPRARFVTLLGQSPTETIANGTSYIEGGVGNDAMYGEDGPAVIHGGTPPQNSPAVLPASLFPQYAEFGGTFTLADECLPTTTPPHQDIIVGGYGGVGTGAHLPDSVKSNDVICGENGDNAILGNRGLVTVVPFANGKAGPTTIGTTGGPPYGTLTFPSSGNTIYQVRLDVEYVDGVLTPVPNWNKPATTGQVNQHDIIFGGNGDNTIHGSPGADFIEGDYGMHISGAAAPATGGDNVIFGGEGNASIEGGPGNADIFGGPGNNDIDVIRGDTAIATKYDNSLSCLPMAFPTINATPSTVVGFCTTTNANYNWADVSYASRFPLPAGQSYTSDPGELSNGGTTSHTQAFGDVIYGGQSRDMMQSDNFGDRMIDDNGVYNLFNACPAAYGGYQIIRALSPSLIGFVQQMGAADGAYNVNQGHAAPGTLSSGDTEVAIDYPGSGDTGSPYPATPGHFTCP